MSFVLGISLVLFISAFNKKEEFHERYQFFKEMKGQVIYIFDTQTGSFTTYISEYLRQPYNHEEGMFTYWSVDRVDDFIIEKEDFKEYLEREQETEAGEEEASVAD